MEDRAYKTREEKLSIQQSQMRELRDQQINALNGDDNAVEMLTANRNSDHEIAEYEKGFVHVMTTVRNLAPGEKSFIDETHIVKIHAREFDRRVSEGAFKTYDAVEVIHDPRNNAPESYNLQPDKLAIKASGPESDVNVNVTNKPTPANRNNKKPAANKNINETAVVDTQDYNPPVTPDKL